MINLKIVGAEEARNIHADGWPQLAVTLLGKQDAHRVPCQGAHHLCLYFDDTELVNDRNWSPVSPWHIQRVLDFTKDFKTGNLLVNCKAGKSRSTAMAIGIMIQSGMTAQDAFDYVRQVRPILIPNRLMIQFIDELLELNCVLEDIVASYYDTLILPGVRLPDRGGWNY